MLDGGNMIFFTDLDNTIIFSQKKAAKGSICVEYKDGQPLTFMTQKTIGLYKELSEKIMVVPVTTRSTEQFMRIKYINDSKYAIVSNGAKLLINGKEDTKWTEYYISYSQSFKKLFLKCKSILENNFANCRVRMSDGVFLYSRLDENVHKAFNLLYETCMFEDVNISESHGKIYVIPKKIGKDIAVKRFCRNYNINDKIISAGDSLMDLNMLLASDITFAVKGELENPLRDKRGVTFVPSINTSDFILNSISDYINKNQS